MSEAEPIETIHLYIVKEEEDQVVDSTVNDTTQTATQPLVMQSYPMRLQLVPYLLIIAHLLIVLVAFSAHYYLLLTETTTIIIVPKSYRFTQHLTLSTVQSRIFPPLTLTQSKTVPATGKGHQPATQAHGVVTFYNTLPQEQTILAGTLLTASNGELFLTDSDVTIPAGTYAVNGQATVSATAQNYGQEGNSAAGAIHGLCCRAGILVLSSAFSGGADERDYSVVTKLDIHSVVSTILPHLTESIQVMLQKQVQPGETLTPNQCSQKVSPDRNVGDEATKVTVMVSESCMAGAYTKSDFQAKVQQALAQQAGRTIGKDYILSSYTLNSPLKTDMQQGKLVFAGTFQGRMIYEFRSQELTTLRQQLAGKTRQQAGAILSHLNGVEHVTFQLGKNDNFPVDSAHINFLFVVENTS